MAARFALTCTVLLVCIAPVSAAAGGAVDWAAATEAVLPELRALYEELHANPEISLQEEQTAARLAARLERHGFDVTRGVGGHGIVGVLRNGPGPTVMLRTDLDGLPVTERTGLGYASTVTTRDPSGATVGVMHACGHDVHMTAWIGAARLLSAQREAWSGTLVLVGQPAEERGLGAKAMLDDGLFERFPRPDFALTLHTSAAHPTGRVTYTPGHAMASVDSVDVVIHGQGGHGAYPHRTVDPVVIAARTILSLQTIVSREIDPLDPAVITVGSVHAGAKHNIIPDEARLQLTVRAYRAEVRDHLLEAIGRIARAEAEGAGAVRPPDVTVSEGTPPLYNDPALTARIVPALRAALGDAAVAEQPPVMAGEDFSRYGLAGVPSLLMWVGAVGAERFARAERGEEELPSLHSPLFAPDPDPTLRTAVRASLAAASALLAGQ